MKAEDRNCFETCFITRWCAPAVARIHFILFPDLRQQSHWEQTCSVTCLESWGVLDSSQGHTGRCGPQKEQPNRMFPVDFCLSRSTSFTCGFGALWVEVMFSQKSDEWLIVVVGWCDCSKACLFIVFVECGLEHVSLITCHEMIFYFSFTSSGPENYVVTCTC